MMSRPSANSSPRCRSGSMRSAHCAAASANRIATEGTAPSPSRNRAPPAVVTVSEPRLTSRPSAVLRRRSASASRGLISEYPSEDRIHMLQVVIQVETGFQLGFRYPPDHLRILLEEGQEVAVAAPHRHRVALHQAIGLLAGNSLLGQGQHHALRMHEPAEAVEVPLHVFGIDHELVDNAC